LHEQLLPVGGTFTFNLPTKALPNIADTFWKGSTEAFEFTQTTGDGKIYHLQSVKGQEPHLNSFLNLGYEDIKQDLFDVFGEMNIRVKTEGHSTLCVCTKK
jgi:hypothetical protein